MQDKILYFQCNDWCPTPKEASKFIEHINGDLFANEDDKYGIDADKQWIKNNELCVNLDVYDIVRKIIKSIKINFSMINCLEPPISLSENPLCGFELRY